MIKQEPNTITSASQIDTISIKYVVVRDDRRVSDREYSNPTDPEAIAEKDFWTIAANKHSHGESVEIVKYDFKKHGIE